jgi:hypothetical protein
MYINKNKHETYHMHTANHIHNEKSLGFKRTVQLEKKAPNIFTQQPSTAFYTIKALIKKNSDKKEPRKKREYFIKKY